MKQYKKILILLFWLGVMLGFCNISYAGTQRLNSLDYEASLNTDGSMNVIETWNIYISETNTLFKDFKLNSSKYSGITDVKVIDLSNNRELTKINEEMYHVTKNCYYALPISGGKFEIAWGVGLDNISATRKYQISYKVENVVAIYNDCSELYWQFVGSDNGIPASEVTGKIKLPQPVKDIESLKVWAHGPLNGEIHKVSNDTVEFFVNNFSSRTMLETRVVVEDEMFISGREKSIDYLEHILKEETKWANQANNKRKMSRIKILLITIIVGGIYGVILIFFFKKILIYKKELKEAKQLKRELIDIGEYFRDIPREKTSTPAEAGFLYYSKKNNFDGIKSHLSNIFSATLLQLCLKGYISFEKTEKNDIKINFLNKDFGLLKEDEIACFEILLNASDADKINVTLKQLKKYAKTNYNTFERKISKMEYSAKYQHEKNENYNKYEAEKANSYKAKSIEYLIGSVFLFLFIYIFALPIIIEFIICIRLLNKLANSVTILSEEGELERQQWKGLKKYMEDFSMLDQRDIPELVLWEKYMIYATAFGIADKVIKQLKVVYPQINNIDSSTYTYMYLMSDSRFGSNFVGDFNKGMDSVYSSYRSAYNAAHSSSSSGSGGGGGFSGGGGGRRRRWPEWEVDNKMKIGIDIGGSHIGIGLIDKQTIIASEEKIFNREDRKNMKNTIIDSIQELISILLKNNNLKIEDIELIGIAAPGTISNGVIVKAGNLNLYNFDIISKLKKIYKNPIQIRNDGKCAALAEKVYGSMKGYDDCVFINIGTGIGGAAFMGGKLLEPKRYSGFEFGHMVLNKGGRLCSCGKQGCFESYSSIKALKMKVTERLDVDSDISGQYLREELLIKDDPGVKEEIEVFLEYLKTGISNLIDIFEPEVICLGGSFAYYEGNPVLDELIKKLKGQNVIFNDGDLPVIVTAELKNDAGIIGSVID